MISSPRTPPPRSNPEVIVEWYGAPLSRGEPRIDTNTSADLLLPITALCVYAGLNLLYFVRNGWLATRGTDLWFYLAVAQDLQPLSLLDVTYWIIIPLRHLEADVGFATLILLCPLLNILSTLLVYRYLGTLLHVQKFHRFAMALLFALLPHNLVMSVASFAHLSVAQPFLILAAGELAPWCRSGQGKPGIFGILCLIEAMIIGPEGYILFLILGLLALSGRLSVFRTFEKTRMFASLAVILASALIFFFFPSIFCLAGRWSLAVRGIDLEWQKNLWSADLLALDPWSISGLWVLLLLAVGLSALWKQEFFMGLLILVLTAATYRVLRCFYALELIAFACFTVLFARRAFRSRTVALVTGLAGAMSLLIGLSTLKTSNFPPHLLRLANQIHALGPKKQVIACSPSYGFLFQACVRLPTTDDLHHRPGLWAELAASTPLEANRIMRENNIAFLVLTSSDFGRGPRGYWSSGGLNAVIDLLNEKDLRFSVATRALTLSHPIVRPLRVLAEETDGVTGQRALCLVPSDN